MGQHHFYQSKFSIMKSEQFKSLKEEIAKETPRSYGVVTPGSCIIVMDVDSEVFDDSTNSMIVSKGEKFRMNGCHKGEFSTLAYIDGEWWIVPNGNFHIDPNGPAEGTEVK